MFDPYHKWLSILPQEQPPNHYRLLGVALFESDMDVIEGAADRQMSFVRQYQSSEHAADAARILNELATARLCLLKPATKAKYDAKLREELGERKPAATAPKTGSPATIPMRKRSPASKAAARKHAPLIVGGIAALLAIVVIAYVAGGFSRRSDNPVVTNDVQPKPPNPGPPAVPVAKQPESDVIWRDSEVAAEPVGQPVDIIKLVDVQRDVFAGAWQTVDQTLVGSRKSRIFLPVSLPADYQLKLVTRRDAGSDTLVIGFVMAGRHGTVVLDGWHSTCSGLLVDRQDARNNCVTWRGPLFQDQTPATVLLTVHPGHLHVSFDGKTVIDWHGDPERLHMEGVVGMGGRESPHLATADAKYIFESISLIPVKPEPAVSRLIQLTKSVEILPLLDIKQDAQRGDWSIVQDTLLSPESRGGLILPVRVPEEYTLSAEFELPKETSNQTVLAMGLPVGSSQCQILLRNGSEIGLDMIDGRRWNEQETHQTGLKLPAQGPIKADFTVTRQGVRVEFNGQTLIDWRGAPWQLATPGYWALKDSRKLSIGTEGLFKLRGLRLGPPVAPPKLPTRPDLSVGDRFDLLTIIDPARDAIAGEWSKEGGNLKITEGLRRSWLAVPFDVPDEYKLTMRVAREPNGKYIKEEFNLGLPFQNSQADIVLDAYKSTVSGLHVDGQNLKESTKYTGVAIPVGKVTEVVCSVRKIGLKVEVTGKPIIEWSGNPDRLTCHSNRAIPGRRICIGSWFQRFRFEKLEIERLPPTSFPEPLRLGPDGDLLAILDVERDSRLRRWRRIEPGVASPDKERSRLRIPASPPDRYILTAVVEREETGNQDFLIGLIVGGHPCAVCIDGNGGKDSGLERLDGWRIADVGNYTQRSLQAPILAPQKRVRIRCHVLPDTVVVSCDDKEIVRWHGDPRRLSQEFQHLPPNYSQADRDLLWLGSLNSGIVVRELNLHPMPDDVAAKLSESFTGPYPLKPQKTARPPKATL